MKNNYKEIILGFDARIILTKKHNKLTIDWFRKKFNADIKDDKFWSNEHKQHFLYKLNVIQPFSTDKLAWPSVFDVYNILRPIYVGRCTDLWENLNKLKGALYIHKKIISHFNIIAIILHYDICDIKEMEKWNNLIHLESNAYFCIPSVRDNSWKFLGYDISDSGGTSALSDCGFMPHFDNVQKL